MDYKYAILTLDNLKLFKFGTKEELENVVIDLETHKRLYHILKNHGEVWSIIEGYVS